MLSVVEALAVSVLWERTHRLIPSKFPPISLFEDCVEPGLLEALYAVESVTNERLLDEAGDLTLVRPGDRLVGPGASPVMAAFTHPSTGRFTDGTFGAYYAADSLATAMAETRHSRTLFLAYTQEEPGVVDMREYIGEVLKPMLDVRHSHFDHLHDVDNWSHGQRFASTAAANGDWGILYRSVREPGGECIAALRPPAVSIPRQGGHYGYVWDGGRITNIFEKTLIV